MKIAITIGHGETEGGSYDPGAINGNYQEFRIAKEIGKAAAEKLREYGADCQLVNYDGSLSLKERIRRFRRKEADLLAEIHLNSGSRTASGSEVWYYPGDEKGKRAAAEISAAIAEALHLPDRGAKASDYYGIIRQTGPTACLVETCFISSSDLEKVKNPAGQKAAGEAVAEGIARATGLLEGLFEVKGRLYCYLNGKPIITDKDGAIL